MRKHLSVAAFVSLALLAPARAADPLADGFANPPEETKPWCYWYWISDNISREGITRDLEAMRRVGIGAALIGNIFLTGQPDADVTPGPVRVLSPEWWELVEHAVREGGRIGVDIGLFNCPGWSQSGGPWISSTQTMRYLASSEIRVTGPQRFNAILPVPREPFQDVAVLAFPAPASDGDSLSNRQPRVTTWPAANGTEALTDGRLGTAFVFPEGAGTQDQVFQIDFELASPMTARTLELFPADRAFAADVELLAADDRDEFVSVRRFRCDWSNLSTAVGFLPRAPETVTFPPVTARRFRLRFSGITTGHRDFRFTTGAALSEIQLSSAGRIEAFVEKQLGRMHPTPLPDWDTYLWPTPPEPDDRALLVPPARVQNLTSRLSKDGNLRWDVPPGEWIIQRVGMTPTGMSNSPASPEGRGFEVDKMNSRLARYHFEAFIGQLLRRMPPAERRALKYVVADSYEMGAQNWTDGFEHAFRRRYGYDPMPWLPALTGRVVGSADQSERFLWDLRRLVADEVATEYVGGLRAACQANGLQLWLENYGHWGFPSEFLKYGGASDRVGGEYWVTGDLGSIECRAASSCANIYGKRFVSAESWTGGPPFRNAPANLKARGDWSFCEGINHVVMHVFIHQPWEDRRPGMNAPWGTEFNRHNTWFDAGRTWIDYLRRCCWMLQQGWRVADVAYFIGDDAPKMTGARKPALPPGRDFDYINSEVIESALAVKNGRLSLPHGTTYRVLVLPDVPTMRPAVLRKIHRLVRDGAVVVGKPPVRSPSLENFPAADAQVRRLARELWGPGAETTSPAAGEHRFGKGRVIWGRSLEEVFAALDEPPAFESGAELRFTHRRSGHTEIFFVANPHPETINTTVALRVAGKEPELWWPDSSRIESPAVYELANSQVRLPLTLGPHGSVFVVFRKPATTAASVVAVTCDGQPLLDTRPPERDSLPSSQGATNATAGLTIAAWVKPAMEIGLPRESARGAAGLDVARNEVVSATHGSAFGDPSRHAGVGLSVGRNGVAVFEHAAGHYAPVLVLATNLADWTHVAVVYRAGRPALYLNGRCVREGVASGFMAHPGDANAAGFRGQVGRIIYLRHPLEEVRLAALTGRAPSPEHGPGAGELKLWRTAEGGFSGWVWAAGEYCLRTSTGRELRASVANPPAPLELSGPWEVDFSPEAGGPGKVVFDQLMDWTQSSEEGIRHYSGRAVYRKSFELPAGLLAGNLWQWWLDLGSLSALATVRLNDRPLGTLWLAPWRVEVTSALRPGTNELEVEVINVWNNRLVGDAARPANERRTYLAVPTVTAQTPLLPAGLLGPVVLRAAARITVAP